MLAWKGDLVGGYSKCCFEQNGKNLTIGLDPLCWCQDSWAKSSFN